jgi:hypothetical protein
MAEPRGSFSLPFTRIEPSRNPKEAVLAVGSHVIVRTPAAGADRITLTAEDGTALAAVKAGAEVEITAWRPRRSGPALYHVRTRMGGKEGWTTAPSLERLPPTPSPARPAAPRPARLASGRRRKPPSARAPARALAEKEITWLAPALLRVPTAPRRFPFWRESAAAR